MSDNRNTLQRSLILASLKRLDHPTAEEVYNNLIKDYPNISKATVYRNLNLLYRQGAIGKVMMSDAADKFDVTAEPHFHVRCRKCGGLFDMYKDRFKAYLDSICEHEGFTIEEYDILFKGICPKCKKENKYKVKIK